MDDDATMRAEYERDLQQIERAAIEALVASTARSLTDDEVMLVAWCAGVSTDVFKELHK